MCMVPLFLPYPGVAFNEVGYIKKAIAWCRAYRNALATNSEGKDKGLGNHIVGPGNEDMSYWSTSNGWWLRDLESNCNDEEMGPTHASTDKAEELSATIWGILMERSVPMSVHKKLGYCRAIFTQKKRAMGR